MGMGGDGGGATTTTKTTQTLPKWLQPYAKQLAGHAASLYGAGAHYPQQQVAPLNQTQQQAFQQFQDLYGNLSGISGGLAGTIPGLTGVTGQLGDLQNQLGGLQGQLGGYGQYAGNLAGQVYPGLQEAQAANQAFMSGQYASPATNPYLQDYYNAAAAPVIANYQQAVAPNILANAVGQGGLGSSGTASAFDAAQANLGTSLQDLASNMYEPAYQQGMSQMQAAIGQQPGLAQAMYTPLQEQLGIVGQQLGANQQQLAANQQLANLYGQVGGVYGQLGNLNTLQSQAAQNILGAGGQQQQQAQNVLNALYQNAMSPYTMLGQAANLIGPLSGGGGTQISVGPNPQQSAK